MGSRNVRTPTVISMALAAVLVLAGCGGQSAPPAPSGPPVVNENYGTVITSDGALDIDPSLREASGWAQSFTYASRSGINDSTTHVTGMLLVPNGTPPDGGWRIVGYGHPASGALSGCAPTLSPTLLDSAPTVQRLLQAGYAVAVTDYQGLGSADQIQGGRKRDIYHPFLDSTTVGYNLIDGVRAARNLMDKAHTPVSDNWLALGIGQGGQAAWAANELAANQGTGLKLVGAVAISPAADIDGLADLADAGTLNTEQKLDLVAFLAGLKDAFGADFNLDDFRGGFVQQKWDALLGCQGQALDERAALAGQIGPDDLKPHTPEALAALRGFLQRTSLPQGPTQAPMMVIYGGQDPLIPAAWTDNALDRACKMGDVIRIQRLPDDAPDQLDITDALNWMGERVNNVPAPNDCGGRTS